MMSKEVIKQTFPHNVHYSTTLPRCWKELCKSNVQALKLNSKKKKKKKDETVKSCMLTGRLKTPLAGLGPFGMGEAKASRQSEGMREQKTGWLPS